MMVAVLVTVVFLIGCSGSGGVSEFRGIKLGVPLEQQFKVLSDSPKQEMKEPFVISFKDLVAHTPYKNLVNWDTVIDCPDEEKYSHRVLKENGYQVYNLTDLGVKTSEEVGTIDGKVECIVMVFNDNFEKVSQMMTEKFGKATAVSEGKLTSISKWDKSGSEVLLYLKISPAAFLGSYSFPETRRGVVIVKSATLVKKEKEATKF